MGNPPSELRFNNAVIVVFVGMNLMRAIRTAPTVTIPIHDSITFWAVFVLFDLWFSFARTVGAVYPPIHHTPCHS